MPRSIWEAIENNGSGVVSGWGLPVKILGHLEAKLDMLRTAEVDNAGKVNLPHKLLVGPKVWKQPGIYKLILNGDMALRPMLCLGPTRSDERWTVLARATERDGDTAEQKRAAKTAAKRRLEILAGTRQSRLYRSGD